MKIYNTLTEQKEDLNKALNGSKRIRLFVCGPTVYDQPHIGHARTAVFFDLVAKYLRSRGYEVTYIQNITDIDDKIIDRAQSENKSPKAIAEYYEKIYLAAMRALGIKSVSKYPRASAHIKDIVKQIKRLMAGGYAYQTSSGIYFEVKKFSDYGKLSKQNLDELRPGWRIEPDPEKRDPLDFALWKFRKHDYEPAWPSPWGEGRPGWHIEDTAITEKYFGPQYELHGGGMDLKFPHHESEIAQQEAVSKLKPFVKIWMHVGFLLAGGQKMSKSLKNFITVEDFLARHSANALRMIIFQHQYRAPLNYEQKMALAAEQSLDSLAMLTAKLKMVKSRLPVGFKIEDYETIFHKKMEDDFNTPEALATIFAFANELNKILWQLSKTEARAAEKWLAEKLKLFGIDLKLPKIPLKIMRLAAKRELFRTHKQFTQADDLRKKIEMLGYTIEDTPLGPFLWPEPKNKA